MLKDKKLYVYFVVLEKAFNREPMKVLEWALRRKRIPDVFVRSVMCVYEGPNKTQSGLCVVRGVCG